MEKSKNIHWGIVGLGNIAHQFCHDLQLVEHATIHAVASRSLDKAQKFGSKFNAVKMFGSYQELFEDAEVDIVYIATPHDSHMELSISAMEAGKHVLCEKPIAMNYEQAKKMVEISKKHQRFFMEAFWSRFNPSIVKTYEKIQEGVIGEIKYINADFAFYVGQPQQRMKDINLGGGSLLDMGVYPLFLSYLILGMPEQVVALANFYETGADKQTSIILQYNNAQAVLHSSFVSSSNMMATISGTHGRIHINPVWHEGQSYSLVQNNHQVDFHHPTKGKGFTYEIEECHSCIWQEQIESSQWSHQDSLNLIQIVDQVRKQTGLIYPQDHSL